MGPAQGAGGYQSPFLSALQSLSATGPPRYKNIQVSYGRHRGATHCELDPAATTHRADARHHTAVLKLKVFTMTVHYAVFGEEGGNHWVLSQDFTDGLASQ